MTFHKLDQDNRKHHSTQVCQVLTWAGHLGVLLLPLFAACSLQKYTIAGRVISARSQLPVENALIYVSYSLSWEGEEHNEYIRSSSKGEFTVSVRGQTQLRAWKSGFALRTFEFNSARDVVDKPVTVTLRPLEATNLVEEHRGVYDLSAGNGFSFSLGRVVDETSGEADMILRRDLGQQSGMYLEASGAGGAYFHPITAEVDFENSPTAPSDGYERKISYEVNQSGFYIVRTHDGQHYAKFYCPLLWKTEKGIIDVANTELVWTYQPDGTRNLENSPKTLPFPMEQCGVRREGTLPRLNE